MMDFHILTNQEKPKVETEKVWDSIIIGGGPAGYNAALYLYRKGFTPLVLIGDRGGQVALTHEIENYLGIREIQGADLVENFHQHILDFNIDIIEGIYVEKLDKKDNHFDLTLSTDEVLSAKTVILATGGEHRKLGVTGEERLYSRGVSYCAICDAPFFKGKEVVVVGGGDSAVEAAIDLSKWANHVHLVHRSVFRAEKILLDRMMDLENVTYELGSVLSEIGGENRVEFVEINHEGNKTKRDVEGVFIEIGQDPRSELVSELVELNEKNEIIVDMYQKTNIPGIYAAGDVTHTPYKQIITAASEGAVAALSASDYILKMEED